MESLRCSINTVVIARQNTGERLPQSEQAGNKKLLKGSQAAKIISKNTKRVVLKSNYLQNFQAGST